MAGFSDYEDFVDNLPDEALLGSLVWFSISNADVPFDKIHDDLDDLNLSKTGLRTRIRPVDAFKKASNIVKKRFGTTSKGVESTILVRQVGQDAYTSHRHVILERAVYKSGQKRRLVYEPVGEMVFTRGSINKDGDYEGYSLNVVRKNPPTLDLSDAEEEWLSSKLTEVNTAFRHMMTHLDSHAIRTFVREYLVKELNAVLVKENGGVYFVPQAHTDEVRRLREWVNSISSDFKITPLVNFDEQRDMLVEAFIQDTLSEVQQMSSDIGKILSDRSRSIRESTHDSFAGRASELISKTKTYGDFLGDNLEKVTDTLAMFKMQLFELSDRIDEPVKVTTN